MTRINFKVIGLTRPGFETTRSRFEPTTFRFPDLPEWEVDVLLIRPPQLVLSATWLFIHQLPPHLLSPYHQEFSSQYRTYMMYTFSRKSTSRILTKQHLLSTMSLFFPLIVVRNLKLNNPIVKRCDSENEFLGNGRTQHPCWFPRKQRT